MNKRTLHSIFLILGLLIVSGCSTNKNTRVNRAYHNVTSKFNILFNGNESIKAGEEKIDQTVQDDFTHLLYIYKDSDPSTAKAVQADMENVILKSSKLIKAHSLTKKPRRRRSGGSRRYQEFARKEEFNKWIDDSYLLMGKAYFYEDNFLSAIENFNYVVRKFPEEKTKYDAYIWLIRCYTESERYVDASDAIMAAENDESFPKHLENDLAVAIADYYVKMGEYDEAIKYLDIAIQKTFWKKPKARLQYILAQLYEETGKQALASDAYAQVAKYNPAYDMAFNAKIKAAGIFTGEGDVEKIRKELLKMLKDQKNIEYRDQIYYALANIDFKIGDRDAAILNYRKSVSSSVTNSFQLAQSAITLANLYFENLDYKNSQAYYDTAMIVIDENYPNYTDISARYNSLSNLVENIFTVEREDSLQRIANMDEAARDAFIDNLISQERKRQQEAKEEDSQGMGNSSFYRANRYRLGLSQTQTGSGWYFYNPQTVAFGKVQFKQRWGERKLEDDWRRSDKTSLAEGEFNEFSELIDSSMVEEIPRENDPMKKEFYTQDLPLTDSLMALSHERIKDALYNAGKLFKSEFNDYERSNESFIELNRRYPDNIYTLSSYFDIYDNFETIGNKERADYYRNTIITQFPESKYAKYLLNPNFFIDLQAQKDSLNRLYQYTFDRYKAGQYPQVITLTSQMKELEPDSMLIPKIDFLHSVALGTQSEMPEFEKLLKQYIETYPDEETTPLAGDILSLIQDSTLSDYQKLVDIGYLNDVIQNAELLPENEVEDEFGGKFTYDDDLLHYFVLAYPRDADFDLNRLKFDIANYNIDNYTKIDFDIENENLDAKTALLVVRSLENKEQSLIYFRSIIRKSEVFKSLGDIDYISFVASSTNYRAMLADKSLTDYLTFFVRNYSRFTRPEFEDEELMANPEELMAKVDEEDEKLEERGTFVMVTGSEPTGLFNTKIDTSQCFVIAIQGDGAPVRPVTTKFSDFNRRDYRIWNLQLQLKRAADYQLVVVKGLPDFNQGMSYFRSAVMNRDLFGDLENISYRNFLITDENLADLTENGELDEYLDFFRRNYLQANVQRSTQPAGGQNTTAEENPIIIENNVEKEPGEYTGPYNQVIDGPHMFVFVFPTEGVNSESFISGIKQYNETTATDLSLNVELQVLDDFRSMVKISGLPDRDTGMRYFRQLVQERSLFVPLGDLQYRNFLITNNNFEIFLQQKNIIDYMDFYKRFYLGQ
ncbi:MAG: tetratricopeptide repeat protein [Prolixibacteraceae bacterium]|nr:tetratricopeptide repeat protein [Prolixibacteraceae bacterium]